MPGCLVLRLRLPLHWARRSLPAVRSRLVLESLLREYRQHRIARFGVWVLAYGIALWIVNRVSGGVSGFLWFLFWISFIPVAGYYFVRLFGFLRRHLLWHLRRRLILTYFFVGVVPIALLLLLAGIATFFLNGQLASFLVVTRLQNRVGQLSQLGLLTSEHAQHSPGASRQAALDVVQNFVASELENRSSEYPALQVTVRIGPDTRDFRLDGQSSAKPVAMPAWLKGEDHFAGIVLDDNQLALRAVEQGSTSLGRLSVIFSEPFTPELLDQVGQGIGPVGALSPEDTGSAVTASATQKAAHGGQDTIIFSTPKTNTKMQTVRSRSLQVPPAAGFFDLTVYNGDSLQPYIWNSSTRQRESELGLFYVTSRIVALNRQVLSTLGVFSGLYWTAFEVLGVIFLVIEFVALVISWRLTRSITTTVDKLNLATERVKAGDFSYRIDLPARDQLTALGEGFDGMTASVERLLKESLEKTRLDGELEIAREVQSRLFPQAAPEVAGLSLYGLCKPARTVSGDYYDFLRVGDGNVALVVGDISGKGISAALLMATLQSALHAQFYDGHLGPGALSASPARTADVVTRLNRQIYASTPREKYVTLFYGVYNSVNRKLTYTNAGHLPPVLFRRNRIVRLEGGGTVVGLFPSARYEQAEVEIEPGDLLLAFTDGMTEPENSYGEEFGEGRLLEVARRALGGPPEVLMDEIYRSVSDWTGSPELQDDMTLVVAQA